MDERICLAQNHGGPDVTHRRAGQHLFDPGRILGQAKGPFRGIVDASAHEVDADEDDALAHERKILRAFRLTFGFPGRLKTFLEPGIILLPPLSTPVTGSSRSFHSLSPGTIHVGIVLLVGEQVRRRAILGFGGQFDPVPAARPGSAFWPGWRRHLAGFFTGGCLKTSPRCTINSDVRSRFSCWT